MHISSGNVKGVLIGGVTRGVGRVEVFDDMITAGSASQLARHLDSQTDRQ